MIEWLMVIGVGIGTYVARVSFIVGLGHRRFPPLFEQALSYVAPAVFAAIVLPAVLLPEGVVEFSPADNPRFLAAIAAALAAWAFKNVAAVIVVGMGALWILEAVL